MDASSRRILVAAVVFGLAMRLAFSLGYWTGKPLTRDEQEYLSLARSLAAGDGFVYDANLTATGVETIGRAPGYPAFLAAVGGGAPSTSAPTSVPNSVKVAQSFVGTIAIVLIGLIASRLAGPSAGAAAAALAAVYPPLVWISAYALSEVVFLPLGLLTVWLFDRAVAHEAGRARAGRAWPMALVAGLAGGLAMLVRPGMAFFFLLAGPWLLVKRKLVVLAALAIGAAVVVLPWTARNIAHYDRVVLVASQGGVTFWTGNHPKAVGEGDLAANPELKLDRAALRARHPGLSEEDMEPIYYREAFDWMRTHPLEWLGLEARKAFYLIVPVGPSYRLHSARYLAASVISYALVLPVAMVGAMRLGRRRAATPGLWLLTGATVAMSLVFFPQERFRIPVIDPMLIVLAGAAVAALRGRADR